MCIEKLCVSVSFSVQCFNSTPVLLFLILHHTDRQIHNFVVVVILVPHHHFSPFSPAPLPPSCLQKEKGEIKKWRPPLPHNSVYITDKTCGCVRSLRLVPEERGGVGHLLGLRYTENGTFEGAVAKDKACKGDMI